MIASTNDFSFYFGNTQESLESIQYVLGLQSIIILDQVHGINGQVITRENNHLPFKSQQGDFLITQEKNIGLGVFTADCLPIIFIDKKQNAVGLAHAGWRGSILHIAGNTFADMQKYFGSKIEDTSIYFGPCAKVCCYEVQKDFLEPFKSFSFGLDSFLYKDEHIFFNLPDFNKKLLLSIGFPQTAFNDEHNYCTICNKNYFSYRRQGSAAGRQVSVVAIK